MCRDLNILTVALSSMYLGLPIMVGVYRSDSFQYLIDSVPKTKWMEGKDSFYVREGDFAKISSTSNSFLHHASFQAT